MVNKQKRPESGQMELQTALDEVVDRQRFRHTIGYTVSEMADYNGLFRDADRRLFMRMRKLAPDMAEQMLEVLPGIGDSDELIELRRQALDEHPAYEQTIPVSYQDAVELMSGFYMK